MLGVLLKTCTRSTGVIVTIITIFTSSLGLRVTACVSYFFLVLHKDVTLWHITVLYNDIRCDVYLELYYSSFFQSVSSDIYQTTGIVSKLLFVPFI